MPASNFTSPQVSAHVGGQARELSFVYDASTHTLTIKDPAVHVAHDWSVAIS